MGYGLGYSILYSARSVRMGVGKCLNDSNFDNYALDEVLRNKNPIEFVLRRKFKGIALSP